MKVVIDIPENDYKLACNYPDALIACYAHYIKAGVPLPKKHGRLIDADKLKDKMRGKWTVYDYEAVGTMPTIVESEDRT